MGFFRTVSWLTALSIAIAGHPSATAAQAQGKEITARQLLEQSGLQVRADKGMRPEVRARLLASIGFSAPKEPEFAPSGVKLRYVSVSSKLQLRGRDQPLLD